MKKDNKELLEEILNECDKEGKPYFSEAQKQKYMESFQSFSTSYLSKDPNRNELERLLSLVKNSRNRYDLEQHLNIYPDTKEKIKFLQKYFLDNDPTLGEGNIIDLTKGKELNESFLRMFGYMVKTVLQRMFGMNTVPVTVKGSQSQIDSFAEVLASEKKYMESWQKNGLDNPNTWRVKSQRDGAISKFERATGLKWPFKD